MNPTLKTLLMVISLLSARAALALPTDAEQDLFMEAESLEADELKGTLKYSGDVKMSQGSMRILADTVIIHGDGDQATKVIAIGRPALFQQTPNVGAEPVKARAAELEYTVSSKSLSLQGDAEIEQEGQSLSGSYIEYDVQNSVVKAGSEPAEGNEKKRVRMVISPKLLESESK